MSTPFPQASLSPPPNTSAVMMKTKSSQSSDLISQAAEDGKKRKSFFSFGDEGLTATVGANGRLLRISRHFPDEQTGLCVDDRNISEPWFVTLRLGEFLDSAEHPEMGGSIGPSIHGTTTETLVNDRWPSFDGQLKDGRKFKLQYVAYRGTIYQKFEFINHNTTQGSDDLVDDYSVPEIMVKLDSLIRDLDFVNGRNGFNEDHWNNDSYKRHYCGDYLVREHVNGKKKGVLSIHVLDEHKSLQFVNADEPGEPGDSSSSDISFMVHRKSATTWNTSYNKSKSKSFSVILAYTLEYVADNETGIASLPPWELVTETMSQLLHPHEHHSLTNDFNPTIDFFLGRNLEYILSVCSIPIPDPSDQEMPFYAITCGDVDGHRVAVAASFNAFQTLLVALKHFQHRHENLPHCDCRQGTSRVTRGSYVCIMMNRIYRVCAGHVKWLLQKVHRPEGHFCPNYWVSGEEIDSWEDNSSLPQKSLVNAPFQIIKACTFIDLVGKDKLPWPTRKLKGAIEAWVKDLDEINKLGLDAFPRYDNEPTQSFYLTDHAMIWQAVKSAERINLEPDLKGLSSTSYSSSTHLKRNVLKRFTTENPQSKKRMLAVTRSPVQTRFLLRSRDTALFHAMEVGLFDKADEGNGSWSHATDLWKSTVECQKDHEDNDDLNWNDPRRFALSLMMARINKSMNLRPAREMFEHAMSVLLRASSSNGLFPGLLNEKHEPISYEYEERRDDYWEVVFEIPYILWKCSSSSDPKSPRGSDEKPGEQTSQSTEIDSVLAELQSISRSSNEISTLLREGQGRLTGSRRAKAPLDYSMKYVQPFNNMVDEENIVELQDKWLYNEPVFFVRSGTPVDRSGMVIPMEDSSWGKDETPGSAGQASSRFIGFMIDVSKSRPSQKDKSGSNNSGRSVSTEEGIRDLMQHERNPEDAKKRLWAFSSASPSGNKACLNTVFEEEGNEQEMQNFFDRHKFYVRFFTEETSAVLNTWTTEIHLSFYRLDTSPASQERTAQKDGIGEAPSLPSTGKGGQRKPLMKVAMSFRFEGDFFDRYWTCRYLEADRQSMDQWRRGPYNSCLRLTDQMSTFLGNGHGSSLGKNSWQQRRVLELMLFGRILQRMNLGAKEVLDEAWFSLRGRRNSTESEEPEYDVFLTTTDDFIISRKRVEQVQRVLRTLIGNLEENIAQIALWENREKDRLAERPRWTFHDEHRFRVIIQKLLVSNDHDMLKLTRVHLKISKLEESLVKKLEILRSDLEERRGGETQLFTYVTVVFLPLGFATGIFSMSDAPATQTLTNMIYTALGAFVVIAVLGLVVKTIISADIVRLPEVTNWTSQDWSKWNTQLKERWRVGMQRVQRGNTEHDDAQTTSSKSTRVSGWIRRLRNRPSTGGMGQDTAKGGSEGV